MNPQGVIDTDEHGTASLEERLRAARRCQEAGYRLGFHFDPMIEYPGWEDDYRRLVEEIFASVDWRRISWLSLGVLRQTPGLKRTMRGAPRRAAHGRQVPCRRQAALLSAAAREFTAKCSAGFISPMVKIYLWNQEV
jgi:DNA repair photolyase